MAMMTGRMTKLPGIPAVPQRLAGYLPDGTRIEIEIDQVTRAFLAATKARLEIFGGDAGSNVDQVVQIGSMAAIGASVGAVGPPGPAGGAGPAGPPGAPVVSAVAAVNLSAGQPVYSDQVSGQFKLANASALTTSSVIGLVVADTMATFIAGADQLSLMLTDWTAVIGAASLTKGAVYFLSTTAGMLTTTPPATPGQTVVRIGVALTTQLMSLAIQEPVLL